MRNKDAWAPSKYVLKGGRLVGSRDSRDLGVSSRLIADRVASLYQKYLPDHAQGLLADLGCGKTPLFQAYRDLVADTVCVDWRSSLHRSAHLDIECDLGQDLPFRAASFGTVVLSDVLEHVAQPDRLWREMSRILKPGGTVLMNVPFLYPLHELPHDYYRYTESALRRFAEVSGFDTLVLEPVGGSPEVLVDLLAKHVSRVPWVGRWLAAGLQGVFGLLSRLRTMQRLSSETAQAYPLGYFMVARRRPG